MVNTKIVGHITVCGIVPRHELEATSKVLNTVELLENVRLGVPPTDLLLGVQLICKGFPATVDTSKPLRRKMFREADYNCDTESIFPYQFFGTHLVKDDRNPMQYDFDFDSLTDLYRQLQRPATFRTLLFVQPPRPVIRMIVVFYYKLNRKSTRRVREGDVRVHGSTSVTAGDIFDSLEAVFEHALFLSGALRNKVNEASVSNVQLRFHL